MKPGIISRLLEARRQYRKESEEQTISDWNALNKKEYKSETIPVPNPTANAPQTYERKVEVKPSRVRSAMERIKNSRVVKKGKLLKKAYDKNIKPTAKMEQARQGSINTQNNSGIFNTFNSPFRSDKPTQTGSPFNLGANPNREKKKPFEF